MSLGYVRVGTQKKDDHAVQWWYFWEYEDGWAFARGGTCRTLREARHLIRGCHGLRDLERRRFLSRPTHYLLEDGSLEEINRGPYDLARRGRALP